MKKSNDQTIENSELSENEMQFFDFPIKSAKILLVIAIELMIIIILLCVVVSVQHSLKEYLFYYLMLN